MSNVPKKGSAAQSVTAEPVGLGPSFQSERDLEAMIDRVKVQKFPSVLDSVLDEGDQFAREGGKAFGGRGESDSIFGGRREEIGSLDLQVGLSGLDAEGSGAVTAVDDDDAPSGWALLDGPAYPVVGGGGVVDRVAQAVAHREVEQAGSGLQQSVAPVVDQQSIGGLVGCLCNRRGQLTGSAWIGDDVAVLRRQSPDALL
nr:hypothetical protein [Streptomyces sp. WZ.A104]